MARLPDSGGRSLANHPEKLPTADDGGTRWVRLRQLFWHWGGCGCFGCRPAAHRSSTPVSTDGRGARGPSQDRDRSPFLDFCRERFATRPALEFDAVFGPVFPPAPAEPGRWNRRDHRNRQTYRRSERDRSHRRCAGHGPLAPRFVEYFPSGLAHDGKGAAPSAPVQLISARTERGRASVSSALRGRRPPPRDRHRSAACASFSRDRARPCGTWSYWKGFLLALESKRPSRNARAPGRYPCRRHRHSHCTGDNRCIAP